VGAKSINEMIWHETSSGIGLDVGLLYNTGWHSLRIGSAVTNFGPDVSFSGLDLNFFDSAFVTRPPSTLQSTPSPVPITFRFGLAYNIIDAAKNKLVADVDLVHPSDINETVNGGLEYSIDNKFFLRGGYILNTDPSYASSLGWEQGVSAGAGIAFAPSKDVHMKLDYGYRNQGYLGDTHRLTLSVAW
jgi:opacity protein-like surface antigen